MEPIDFRDRYKTSVVFALAGFQMIEESLKTYMDFYHNAVRANLPPGMVYKYSRDDIEDAPLGKLLMVFSKTTANDKLVAALRKLQKDRDQLAHRAFLGLYGEAQESPKLKSDVKRIMNLADRTNEFLVEIQGEILAVLSAKNSRVSSGRQGEA